MEKKISTRVERAVRLLACCMVFLPVAGLAQGPAATRSFAYQATIDTVKQAGFYKITLQPDLLAKCREDLSDLRIADKEGNFIPYVLKSDLPVFTTQNFIGFPILFNEKLKDSSTELVIANGSSGSLSALLLVMKNISARRSATLSGSDDRQKWFVIREHIELQEAGSDTADHYVQAISFPPSNYRFFKLILDDKGLLPVNMLKAGMYTRNFTNGKYLGVPYPALSQKDSSNKHSYILLQYRDRYRIDKLEFIVQGPALYKRQASVYDNRNGGYRLMKTIALSPSENSFLMPAIRTDSLLLDIANEDNAPLVIQAVRTAQLNQYLLTYLQPGSGYSLLGGDPQAAMPAYDLKYFTDSLTRDPEEVATGPLKPGHVPGPVQPVATDHSGIWLWGILGLVLVLLAFLSFKMIKAIPKDK
ncbi:MAG TPA: hypothetical protein VK563_08485 [Puia sp.]|nr:hypothetical protein [Puia sp.]